ncbi:MAG: hypothetical protein NTX65_10530 [Ignavibacteriales bacterium]|nr:hypothetical protein [Ignavibacteriales bacterium]
MNTFLKSIIIYSELFLLTIFSSVTIFITPNYYETRNNNSTPTIERNNFLSELFYVKNNHQNNEERDPQTKADHLSLVNCPPYFDTIKCFGELKSQSLISSITPEYLLSSDLKSPPKN